MCSRPRYLIHIIVTLIALFSIFATNAFSQDSLRMNCVGQVVYGVPRFWDVTVQDNFAYIADRGNSMLRVIRISDPANPQEVGCFFSSPGQVLGSVISGNYAFVASGIVGLRCIDISDSSRPHQISYCQLPGSAEGVVISGQYAYVVDNNCGLRVVNISNVENLFENGHCDIPGLSIGIEMAGQYVFIANFSSGLKVVNITNPLSPVVTGSFDTPGYTYGLAISGNYAYLADYSNGVVIVNISNPENPTFVSNYRTPGNAMKVHVWGSYALVANEDEGVRILNISDPVHPTESGYYNTIGRSNGVAVRDNYVYVADAYYFGIYDCSQALGVVDRVGTEIPQEFSLKQNYPNPFNATTTFEYTIPKTGKVDLKVFDVSGREVATLVDFHQNPGTYKIAFDGTSLSTGTYFLRLQSGTFSQTQKMVLLK